MKFLYLMDLLLSGHGSLTSQVWTDISMDFADGLPRDKDLALF